MSEAGGKMNEFGAIVVGGGQAGLAASHELGKADVDHIVLERDRIGETWRRHWQSFCLVTPNWSVQLPGHPYDGDDPDGFMPRDEIVAYLNRYAASFNAPVREGVAVVSVTAGNGDRFALDTSDGAYRAASLVLATGAYQRPHRPAGADTLPIHLLRIDVDGYHSPEALPSGAVLIVGSGQSGCQIAEELHQAGRQVVLACGRAPWCPRRIGDHDLVWWAVESGFFDATVESLPSPNARLAANILASGHQGGHDMHLRTLRALGITLTGHFRGANGTTAHFAPDLADSLAWGDERYHQLKGLVKKVVDRDGLELPDLSDPEPFDPAMPEEVDLTGFGTVLFAGGFRPDFSWLSWPDAFDEHGFPLQKDGTSTVVDGLHFVGLHFLRKRKSALLIGVGEDAAIVAGAIAGS